MVRSRWLCCAMLVALTLGACAPDDSAPVTEPPTSTTTQAETPTTEPRVEPTAGTRSVVVDTDVSIDDLMAIPYLLRHPDIDVAAITVSGTGVARCDAGVELVRGLLAVSQRTDIPVACGPELPIEGSNAFPGDWRDAMDRLAAKGLFPAESSPEGGDAIEVLTDAIRTAGQPVTALLLGPHTNLAAALRADPSLADDLDSIVMMGGAIDTPGNTFENPDAEWNLWIDPVADEVVLATDVPIAIVPLDATNYAPLTTFFADTLADHQGTPEARAVHDLLMDDPSTLRSGLSFWDQLAAVAMVSPDVVTWEDRDVTVLQAGGPPAAGTLAAGLGRPAAVAVAADREAFEAEYLSVLTGDTVAASEWSTDASITVGEDLTWAYDGPTVVPIGALTVLVDNRSEHRVLAANGRLIEGGTTADLDAWPTTQQPPFLEVDEWTVADPRIQAIWEVAFAEPGEAVLIGLDLTDDIPVWNTLLVVEP